MPAVESEELPSEIAKIEEYNCPINMEIMVDPVTLSCHALRRMIWWYAQRHTCPCCRADEQRNNVLDEPEVNKVLILDFLFQLSIGQKFLGICSFSIFFYV